MTVFAALERDRLEVHPGGGVSVPLTVRNTGSVVNDYRFEVLGPSSQWAEVEPATLPLFPGQDGTVTVSWRPPRTPEAGAGRLPFGVRVVPSEQPEDSVVEEGTIKMAPFYAIGVNLVPATSRGRFFGAHRVVVENQSNAVAAVALAALDPDARLRFRMRPTAFRLKVGSSRTIHLRAHPRRHKIKGHPERRPFQVFASVNGQDPTRTDAAYEQRALVAGWQFKVALLALLILLAAILIPIFRPGSAVSLANASIPAPPLPVVARPVSRTSIRLTWSGAEANRLTGYEIQSGGQTVATPSADETAHVFTGLTTGTTYCYVIKALDTTNSGAPASGFSPPACATPVAASHPAAASPPAKKASGGGGAKSSGGGQKSPASPSHPSAAPRPKTIATAPPPAPGAPPAPVPVTASVLGSTAIRLTWTPHGHPLSFVIQDGGQTVASAGGTDSAHLFSGLTPRSQHCYVIWAVGAGGASPHVGPLCATTLGTPGAAVPPVPSDVSVQPVSGNGLQVSWASDPTNVTTSYQIFENGSLAATQPAGATGNTFTNLAPGSHHCYAVRALAGATASAFAPDVCGTVNAGAPGNVNLGQPGIYSLSVASITPSEGDGRAVIGATVDYTARVNIPTGGASHADLLIGLPSGMALQSPNGQPQVSLGAVDPSVHTDYPGGFAAAAAAATYTAQAGQPPGELLDVPLGDVTNSSGDPTQAQTVSFRVPAVVLNADDVGDGGAMALEAVLQTYSNGAPVRSAPVTSTITVANPFVNATITGSTLQLNLSQAAGAVAYNVVVYANAPCTSTSSGGSCSGGTAFFSRVASGGGVSVRYQAGCLNVRVEWLSAPYPRNPRSQIEASYAYPRSGPDDPPVGSPPPQSGTQFGQGDINPVNACTG